MSAFNDIDIECIECTETFQGTVWSAIHAGLDPELKDLLLGGELNLVACPHCGYVTFQDRFLIYQEPTAELIAYVYPEAQQEQEADLRVMMLKGFHDAQATMPQKAQVNYEPLLFFGLESLIQQLKREEGLAEQSQVAEVLCKENKIGMEKLKPSQARRLKTVRVVPHTGKGHAPSRGEILEGINQLLEINPVLDDYATLKEMILADPGWSLPA